MTTKRLGVTNRLLRVAKRRLVETDERLEWTATLLVARDMSPFSLEETLVVTNQQQGLTNDSPGLTSR